MPNPHSLMLTALAAAPAGEIPPALTARFKAMAAAGAVAASEIAEALRDAEDGRLTSGFALTLLRALLETVRRAEGAPDADERRRAERARAADLAVTGRDLDAALYRSGATDAAQIGALLEATTALLRAGRADEIDAALERLRPDELSPLIAVGVLRTVAAARDSLPHWPRARERVRASLRRRGHDAARLLRGL